MYTVLYSKENNQYKNYMKFFHENEIPFHIKKVDFISYEDFLLILSNTIDGLEEILAVKSKAYANLKKNGVELDNLTIKEVYELLLQQPTLMRLPIVFNEKKMVVGFNETEIGLLLPRETKRKAFRTTLAFVEKLFPQDSISMDAI